MMNDKDQRMKNMSEPINVRPTKKRKQRTEKASDMSELFHENIGEKQIKDEGTSDNFSSPLPEDRQAIPEDRQAASAAIYRSEDKQAASAAAPIYRSTYRPTSTGFRIKQHEPQKSSISSQGFKIHTESIDPHYDIFLRDEMS